LSMFPCSSMFVHGCPLCAPTCVAGCASCSSAATGIASFTALSCSFAQWRQWWSEVL
jgi:hypothetical protein